MQDMLTTAAARTTLAVLNLARVRMKKYQSVSHTPILEYVTRDNSPFRVTRMGNITKILNILNLARIREKDMIASQYSSRGCRS